MPPDADAALAADELQSLSFGSSERSRSTSTVSTATASCSTSSSGPIGLPPSRSSAALAPSRLGTVQLSDIRFVRRLGAGDIGSVYLAEIKGKGGPLVAAKVMDRKELQGRNKEGRARTEREILEAVDHPFLPRLYGVAEGERWSCLLTEFCPGGDLHVLRQRQPHRRFSEAAVRAEINIKPWDALQKDLDAGNRRVRWIDREPYAYWKGNPDGAATRQELVKCNVSSKQEWNARIYKQDWIKESKAGYKKSDLASQCTHRSLGRFANGSSRSWGKLAEKEARFGGCDSLEPRAPVCCCCYRGWPWPPHRGRLRLSCPLLHLPLLLPRQPPRPHFKDKPQLSAASFLISSRMVVWLC